MAKCIDCKFMKVYHTGFDEYPPCVALAYCSEWHWENGPQESEEYLKEIECIDFEDNQGFTVERSVATTPNQG